MYLELHRRQLINDIAHRFTNLRPCNLVVADLHSMGCMGVEANHVAEHPGRLVEWAVAIIVTVAVLLQKVILDDLCDLQRDLVCFVQTRLLIET